MTRRDVFDWAVTMLQGYSDEERLDATRLLEHVLDVRAEELIAFDTLPVAEEALQRIRSLIMRRQAGEPVAYLCGEAWFYGRRFAIDARVLVPRPETELMVDVVLDEVRARPQRSVLRIADIGTGSGILAITLALEVPRAELIAVDISTTALALARENAVAHNVAERVVYLHGDLLANMHIREPFDVIVANLPYLRTDELPRAPDPTSFEPCPALDGGVDGLELYRRLCEQLMPLLRPGALVVFEAAPPTMRALTSLAARAFPTAQLRVERDYGGNERLCILRFS